MTITVTFGKTRWTVWISLFLIQILTPGKNGQFYKFGAERDRLAAGGRGWTFYFWRSYCWRSYYNKRWVCNTPNGTGKPIWSFLREPLGCMLALVLFLALWILI